MPVNECYNKFVKVKAIIFDIDGTAIPTKLDAIPSVRLIRAVKKAQKLIKVCAATGRSLPHARKILQALNLKDPCIISGGTQIIDPTTEKTLWEKRLSELQVKQVMKLYIPYSYEVGFSDEIKGAPAKNKKIKGSERIIYLWGVTKAEADKLQKQINKIDGIVAHIGGSWTKNRVDIHATHREATKKYALEQLLKLLHVDKKYVIGIGDTDNDLPLFESVGYKVAMSNGTDKLKSMADHIALSVDEDGLAIFIEEKLSL